MPETPLADRVFAVLAAAGRPLKAKEVCDAVGLGVDDRAAVRDALRDLVEGGRALQLEGRRFLAAGAPAKAGLPSKGALTGVVQRKASGVGWFVPDDKAFKDAFVPPAELRAVVDGDRVLARVDRGPRGPVAAILRVLSRARSTVTGVLHTSHDRRFGRSAWVEVDDNVLSGPVQILVDGPSADPDVAVSGDIVEVQLVDPPTAMTPATGRILRRIGRRGELDTEIERLVVQAGITRPFPPDALAEAGRLGDDPDDDDLRGRLDLRDLPIVTIDGETAKDFDDAVYATKGRGKAIEVTVCVADVSHYIPRGSALDVEARRRGTSVYYPGRVIPMLPEALSNGLCSLQPRVPRLCAVVRFRVDENGGVSDERFDFGVMRSRARLTYSLVQRFFDEDDGKSDPYPVPPQPKEAAQTTAQLDDEVRDSLRCLREAAVRLRRDRQRRGALDFELPELVIELDPRREPVAIRPLQRAFSHKLIEDLMIAANEAAARFFHGRGLPCVYRVHDRPDDEKLGRFLSLAAPAYALVVGRQLPRSLYEEPANPQALMSVMEALGDHPSRQALDMLLLRSMKQAQYSVDNVGHYGLGSAAYLHFTSPIRRYPDLVVHRLLREQLDAKRPTKKTKKKPAKVAAQGERATTAAVDVDEAREELLAELEDIAASSSELERRASELERAIQALHACWLMKDRIGEVHAAVVTGVSEAGAFVRLTDLFVEGLVRIADLGSEYFVYDEERLSLRGEHSGEVITLGSRFDVEVSAVDFARRQIGFVRPQADVAARHRHDRLERWTRWEPRTDARRRGAPTDEPPAAAERAPPSTPVKVARAAARKERRQARVEEAIAERRARRARGEAVSMPDPRGRSRQERFERYAAYESARRAIADGTATDADVRYVEERKEHLSAWRREKNAARRERAAKRRAAAEEREIARQAKQRRYERQQQIARAKPEPPAERPRIRGPEDLRALFEARAQRGGDGAVVKERKTKKPAKKKKAKKKPSR